jgi:hypothetical protein
MGKYLSLACVSGMAAYVVLRRTEHGQLVAAAGGALAAVATFVVVLCDRRQHENRTTL